MKKMKSKPQAAAGGLLGGRRRAGIIAIFLAPLCVAATVLAVALTLRPAQAAPGDACTQPTAGTTPTRAM